MLAFHPFSAIYHRSSDDSFLLEGDRSDVFFNFLCHEVFEEPETTPHNGGHEIVVNERRSILHYIDIALPNLR